MNCLKCGAELVSDIEGLEKDSKFRLRYGRGDEEVYTCPNGCGGLWTETSLRLAKLHRKRRKLKLQRLRAEL